MTEHATSKRGVLTTGTCDERIGHYRHAIQKAKRGQGQANIEVYRVMLDKWLEARKTASPGPRQTGKELV